MSLRTSLRALPTLLRIGFSEAVAYRAEMVVWVLATTMPLIMLALWSAVARGGDVGRFGQAEFTGYFLAAFCVRQLTSSWVAWMLSYEVKQGTLAMRLLRPISPLLSYATEVLAGIPLRVAVVLPVLGISVWAVGGRAVPASLGGWGLFALGITGGWLITFYLNVMLGALSLYLESSQKLMEIYMVLFFVCSGYMFPVEFFPPGLRAVMDALPFRYQMGLPVELMTGAHAPAEAWGLLAKQWAWVAGLGVGATLLWRRGLARFAAFGG
ncbi:MULTISPECIES: ABC-2 family transporter protein [Corallococcus]|uniref:ABC transporter permease n=1 Tax=Corallococcus TaxID=83461 RepID=UPI00117FFF22|nr:MULTISPECIES: ABC-2 family transporter protein [Corallococcus]NBD13992.1 ABC transporter permease [Corallococcus silvisoli]TSC25045.1 ABC transporter permease [Corallococcus sp. Z5C101001]